MAPGEPTTFSLRRVVLGLACVAVVALGLVPEARADVAGPVRSFGNHGSVVVRIPHRQEEGLPLSARRIAGHRFQMVLDRQVRQFDSHGRPDPGFAGGGRLDLTAGIAPLRFEPKALVPEIDGGLLVGGTTTQLQGRYTELQSWSTVRRYLPTGKLDPAFAAGGTLTSQFGMPAPVPAPEGGGIFNPFEASYYEKPHVSFRGLSADRQGLVTVEGSAVIATAHCPTGDFYGTKEEFVAHLSADGTPDESDGPDGIGEREAVEFPCTPAQQGDEVREISRAKIGTPKHAREIAIASGTDARGRTVLLLDLDKKGTRHYLVRLTKDGRFDRSFGNGGKLGFGLPHGKREAFINGVRVAPDGSTLLLGMTGPAYVPGHGFPDSRFYIGRATKHGKLARSFGRDGFLTAGPAKVRIAEPIGAVNLGDDQVVVYGGLGEFARQGYVLTSVRPGA